MTTTTAETCHCGASFGGSDHCPCCGCEQFERYCESKCLNPFAETHEHDADEVPAFDPMKLLGELAGYSSFVADDLQNVKKYLEQNGGLVDGTAANYHWRHLDEIACRLAGYYDQFQRWAQTPRGGE